MNSNNEIPEDFNNDVYLNRYADGDDLGLKHTEAINNSLKTDADTRERYDKILDAKAFTNILFDKDHMETPKDVTEEIRRLVEQNINEDNVITFRQKLQQYAYQAPQLAAVFIVGLVLSPTLMETFKNKEQNQEIVQPQLIPSLTQSQTLLSQEQENVLRSGALAERLEDKTTGISIEILSVFPGLIFAGEPFKLNIFTSAAGNLSIFINSTTNPDANTLGMGNNAYWDQVPVGGNTMVQFPEKSLITLDPDDTFVRFDLVFFSKGVPSRYTKIIPILG